MTTKIHLKLTLTANSKTELMKALREAIKEFKDEYEDSKADGYSGVLDYPMLKADGHFSILSVDY